MTASAALLAAIDEPVREITTRAELVDFAGQPVGGLPFIDGRVTFRGSSAQSWAASLTLADPALVPASDDGPLWPWSGLLCRLWWRISTSGAWHEYPLCTVALTQPSIEDDGILRISVTGRDVLADAARGGYGGTVLNVGGMTVPDALVAIFAAVAPGRQVRVDESSVTLPAVYALGERSVQDDWTEVAAMAGWVVRSDRMGVIVCGPVDASGDPVASWQEGAGCKVSKVTRDIETDTVNRVVCTSTNSELTVPVVGVAEDDDEGSPTWVGRFGPYQADITSDLATTEEACLNLARAELARLGLRPLETVTVTVPQRPDLDYLDGVWLDRPRAGVGGLYRVDGWDLPLGNPGVMTVTMIARAA